MQKQWSLKNVTFNLESVLSKTIIGGILKIYDKVTKEKSKRKVWMYTTNYFLQHYAPMTVFEFWWYPARAGTRSNL